MPGITTPYNLQMPSAGLIGRGSGAGRSTILDAAAVRSFTSTLTSSEVSDLISASVANYLPLAGGTVAGILKSGTNNQIFPFNTTAFSTYTANGTGLSFFGAGTGAGYGYCFSGDPLTLTTGARTEVALRRTFAPTSGNATFAELTIAPTINQTGSANGASRGLYITPTITAAADWKAIEVTTGRSCFQAVEAAGNLLLQNATTAVLAEFSKTFTSSTNREYAQIGFSGVNYDFVSRVGSAGGSNQPIRVGHLAADGTTFAGFDLATTGKASFITSAAIANSAAATGYNFRVGTSLTNYLHIGGLDGTPNYGMFLQTSNSSYPLILQGAGGRILLGKRTDDGTNLLQVAGSITASGNLTLQNSTTAVIAEISKTYTSSTNREYFYAGFSGTNYDLVSRVGSAGGSNQPLRLGHIAADGTTFVGLTVGTTGNLTIASSAGTALTTIVGATTATLNFSPIGVALAFGPGNVLSTTQALTSLNRGISSTVTLGVALPLDASASVDLVIGRFRASASQTADILQVQSYAGAATYFAVNASGITGTQKVGTTGSPTLLTLTGAAHTTLTASTEAVDVNFNFARTVQFATGAITTQRAMRIQAPTYAFVGASTITTASTVSISGPPVAGTNATITNAYALNVVTGTSNFGGQIIQSPPASVTLATNGQFTIEMTSNTAGNLVYRGSDGTTRRMALTFS